MFLVPVMLVDSLRANFGSCIVASNRCVSVNNMLNKGGATVRYTHVAVGHFDDMPNASWMVTSK